MATTAQRVQAICDALVNGTATPAQQSRLGTAFATVAGRLAEYNAATNAGKGVIFLDILRTYCISVVKQAEGTSAAIAATANAQAQVDTDFAELP